MAYSRVHQIVSHLCVSSHAEHTADTKDPKQEPPDSGRYASYRTMCLEHVPGWKSLSRKTLFLKPLLGGLSNELFTCEARGADSEVTKVVVRVYGQAMSALVDPLQEHAIAQAFAKKGLGPAIYLEFEDGSGRIERFFPGKTLYYQHLHLPHISLGLAKYLAKMHAEHFDLDPKESQLFPRIRKWLDLALNAISGENAWTDESRRKKTKDLLQKMNFTRTAMEGEIAWLENHLRPFNSPVVFCHNDLQEGNVLMDEKTHALQVIDFEYGSYNNRGFDLGNFFCEWLIDNQYEDPPCFRLDVSRFPSPESRALVLTEYLGSRASSAEVQKLDQEVYSYMLASHMYWVIWAVFQAYIPQVSTNKFDYIQYAYERWSEYHRQKQTLAK